LVIGFAFALRLERTADLVLKETEGIKNIYGNLQFYGETNASKNIENEPFKKNNHATNKNHTNQHRANQKGIGI